MSDNVTKTDGFLLAAALAAVGRPAREIASAVGVCERTVRRWNGRPSFRAVVTKLRNELLSTAIGRLLAATGDAADTLAGLLTRSDEQLKFAAAAKILQISLRARESEELRSKIEELEILVKELLSNEPIQPRYQGAESNQASRHEESQSGEND